MRQCGAVNDVADGIYAFDIRTVEVVYCYFVALERDARLFETESFEVRLDADCRKDDVGRKYLFAFFSLRCGVRIFRRRLPSRLSP